MKFRMFNGCDRGLCRCAVGRQDRQLNTYDWLADVPGNAESTDLVEVQFKNTRKGYYHNVNNLDLKKGDVVAVEANPGHDIGVVTLTGRLVKLQIKKANLRSADDIKRIYRIAKPVDFEKWEEAKSREHGTMIQSRQIAKDLGLKMKIGDVEYQGDGNKAIFYYIADERVDFRQLIKVLADTFHVRIEMKQIGARQEAGRIGGTGPCGRELCCATWMKNFVSVGTNAARFQDISLNPQKLAGMCAKLKCCLNYEVDNYVEASKKLPPKDALLQTADGEYHQFKVDILAGLITYSTDKNLASNLETISAERAWEIIKMNKAGEKPLSLIENGKAKPAPKSSDLLAEADLSRFDKAKKKKKNNNRPQNNRKRNAQGENRQQADNRAENKQQGENRQGENRQQGENRPNRQQNNRRRNNNRPRPQQGESNKGEANKAEANKTVANKGEGNKGEANKGGENKAPNNE
nr:regulatory iron-sulfur-containing complex subunit RicT [uncultured Prevotella sp.]